MAPCWAQCVGSSLFQNCSSVFILSFLSVSYASITRGFHRVHQRVHRVPDNNRGQLPWRLGRNTGASLFKIAPLSYCCHVCWCHIWCCQWCWVSLGIHAVVICQNCNNKNLILNFESNFVSHYCCHWEYMRLYKGCYLSGRYQSSQLNAICQSCINRSLFPDHH